MRTNRVITRLRSERVAMRPIVNKHLWEHYFPLVVGKNQAATAISFWRQIQLWISTD